MSHPDHFFASLPARLRRTTPASQSITPRRLAIQELDAILQNTANTQAGGAHDIGSPGRPSNGLIEKYFMTQLGSAINEIISPLPAGQFLRLWLIYNAGVIIKTASLTIGIDVVIPVRPGWWSIDPHLIEDLAGALDILFISHSLDQTKPDDPFAHGDHYDQRLVRAMLRHGKRVVMNSALRDLGVSGFYKLELSADEERALFWVETGRSYTIGALTFWAFTGQHVYKAYIDHTPHLAYQIRLPEGPILYHSGDLDYTLPSENYGIQLAPGVPIDILCMKLGGISPSYDDQNPASKGDDLAAFQLGLAKISPPPALVIPCHLAELGHPVGGGRESYTLGLRLEDELPTARLLLWGESCEFKPAQSGEGREIKPENAGA
jgi:L-ascorbate metabolism protein UlaG (beta-lactamase superfamily)